MPRPGTTTERDYGADHQAERERWRPHVEAGTVDCHAKRCLHRTRLIRPGTPWDLGHTDDRTTWTGPEHATCNRTAGAHMRGKTRTTKPVATQRIPRIPVEQDEW